MHETLGSTLSMKTKPSRKGKNDFGRMRLIYESCFIAAFSAELTDGQLFRSKTSLLVLINEEQAHPAGPGIVTWQCYLFMALYPT